VDRGRRVRLDHPDPSYREEAQLRIVDMADLAPQQRHELFSRLVAPHPTAMISTLDAAGELLVAPLGYCVPLGGRQATIAVTIAAVRDAGGEPELVRAAALASGQLVANLTTLDLPDHLAELATLPRERGTGAPRWPSTASQRVAVPSLASSRARLECRVIETPVDGTVRDGPGTGDLPAVRDASMPRPPTGYAVIAEVVCVVADDDLLAPPQAATQPSVGRAEFPWFFGPGDRSIVDGTEAHPVIEHQAIER
jgi:flavin reductase (DIM6/NTAB) family NADH-FMN oxidoreductase RutF